MQPTDQQVHIVSLATDTEENLEIDALAGTGKSSTLNLVNQALPDLPRNRDGYSILSLVFNKRNCDEAKAKQKKGEYPPWVKFQTVNGCGHGIWQSGFSNKISLDVKKCRNLLKQIIEDTPKKDREELWDVYWDVLAGVEMAKAIGYVPEGKWANAKRLATLDDLTSKLEQKPDDLTIDLIDATLLASIKAAYAGSIDFNDQVYMPAVFGGTFPRFPLVEVDEHQDFNPVNHAMLVRLATKRLIGVGDPNQCIYVFRGANSNGMAEAVSRYQMTECDLSVSFRCPEAIVKAAQWRVPKFRWFKSGGHVEALKQLEAGNLSGDETFICRNNAPLFRLGMQLLAGGKPITIQGSDIGPKLVGIMRKLGDASISRTQLISAIEDWRTAKLERESTTASDLADCMLVFAEHGDSLGQAIAYAEHLFQQSGSIKLLTGHKSKGLEFDRVFLLDTFLLKDDEQDKNLRYVMQTRSQNELYEIDSDAIKF